MDFILTYLYLHNYTYNCIRIHNTPLCICFHNHHYERMLKHQGKQFIEKKPRLSRTAQIKILKFSGRGLNTPLYNLIKCKTNTDSMQEKLQKLFSFFKKIKNEPFYTSIITQIIQTYETCPESLKFILYNLNQLIFTNTQEVKLRIKHRLICASIVAKLSVIYVTRIRKCIQNNEPIDLENFQLQTDQIQNQNEQFKSVIDPNDMWEKLDLFKIIQTQDPLMSTRSQKNQANGEQKAENNIFQQYINMSQATMMNIQQLFKDIKSDKSTFEIAFEASKTKYQTKMQKIKKKKQQYAQKVTLRISNPFNLLYQICVDNLLSPEWQLRHLSALILKQLMSFADLLGFSCKIEIQNIGASRDQRFKSIEMQTRDRLKQFSKNPNVKNYIINKTIILNLRLLCRDKFGDYQSDQSNIIVRNKSAETLAKCYLTMTPNQQIQMLKRCKKIFDRQIKIEVKSNFSWQTKHSFLAFINFVNQYPEQQLNIYKILQESMIKMLILDQQIDQIVYAVCLCFKKYIGQKFFGPKQIQRVNQQVWKIVKNLDDISISTVSALQLLQELFPYFNLNICNSLQEIRKFFTSKIPEVRKQCYILTKMLYEKKFNTTNDKQKKLVQSNIIQFLQASVVEFDKQIFHTLMQLSPSIFFQVRKEKKIFQVVQFIIDVVLCQEYTDKLIQSKFKLFETFGLDKNDYLFFYEHEKQYITVDKYVDKRIWKISEVIAKGFENSYENFNDLITSIELRSNNSDRGKLLILHILVKLVGFHHKQQLFTNYTKIVSDLMKLDFSSVNDVPISELKAYSEKTIKELKEKSEIFSKKIGKLPTDLKQPKQIVGLHGFLCEQLHCDYDTKIKELVSTQINVIQNLIEHQRTLFKQIKVLSTCYFVKREGFSPETLNSTVASIRQALEQDRYIFLSECGAETFVELSNHLKSRKAVFSKIVSSILVHISNKYQKKELKIEESQHGYNLRADYMMGIKLYIQKIGIVMPEWLQMFKQHFIKDYQSDAKDPTLFLVSGTIQSLLKICDYNFLQQMLAKLEFIADIPQAENKRLFYDLLVQAFYYLCENYTSKSDLFFEWFLNMLKKGHLIFLQALMRMGEQNIFKIAGICSIFVLQIVRLLSQQKSKDMAMICLSNIVVGVYMNNKNVQFGQKLQSISEQGIEFVKNFRDASNFQYKNRVALKSDIDIRSYQQEGIQWLGFLTKFNLNGALCDDMGLGKTLQVFILLQNEYLRDIQENRGLLPSLIVSPTTLTQHWAYEYSKYFTNCLCVPHIVTTKTTSLEVHKKSAKPILYIVSYQVLQKKIQLLQQYKFKFIFLDEGHVIKNPKTNKFMAVKRLNGLHRFILTGTPIQNKLKELWSLFDFLMPGYLYTKQVFKSHYQKLFQVNLTTFKQDQLLFSDEQKKILQKLHLKVMPFIMRRMKSQVLKQLPQKIINDYYCQMTSLQAQLYSDFQCQNNGIKKGKDQQNILSSLSKMRKILNHPNLIGKQGNYQCSGKFIALNELFEQLGFRDEESMILNKVIIFSRSTSTIELLQTLFMKHLYPKLKYTKLTAAVKPNERFMVAQNFNGDNDIKVLLVTTSVGGEGLNLTSANTVIMFDHDYNPTVDMQAIDRAHRIGQRRVLNVYRLITKNTLEERIMGIQKFKKNLAQAIVNIDNSSIKNIEDSKLPQLLENMKDLESKDKKEKIKKSFFNKLIQEMQNDAIDQEQYDKEY